MWNPLKDYLASEEIRQADFARRIGVTRGFLNDILKNRRKPGLDVAVRIASVSKGVVPTDVWPRVALHATSRGRDAAATQVPERGAA